MKVVITLLTLLALQACKHPLAIVGEGDIVDLNDSGHGCTLEQFGAADPACTENEVLGEYNVNFAGVPRPGWRFVRWEGSCGHQSIEPNCAVATAAAWVTWWDQNQPDTPVPTTTAVFELDDGQSSIDLETVEDLLMLNELNFVFQERLGQKLWVPGYFGAEQNSADGLGLLVDNPRRLLVDEEFPHHSYARLDGNLPPASLQGDQIKVYGEVKDFGAEYGQDSEQGVPLITVIDYEYISTPEPGGAWGNRFRLDPVETSEPAAQSARSGRSSSPVSPLDTPPSTPHGTMGVQASECDRSVIISGGVDAGNNHHRYITNVIAKHDKMLELGFTPDQIEVFYNDGAPLGSGTNIVDEKTDKARIREHFDALTREMRGSCTLTLFITDHGTGYSEQQDYSGARPALGGAEATAEGGMLFPESTFMFNGKDKVWRESDSFELHGFTYVMQKHPDGEIRLYFRPGDSWERLGGNEDNSSTLTEEEAGFDIDRDGDIEDDSGIPVSWMETRLNTRLRASTNNWDTDKDGGHDVRLILRDGRFRAERKVGTAWKEMGSDTNGDNMIDAQDGGVDWNLDGDTNDQVGFHEGINLWGRGTDSVLWDDELAEILQPLTDLGVHIMVEMVSCFSGGIVPNIEGLAENVFAGSSENTKHYNRINVGDVVYAADELEFLLRLTGIDTDSWNRSATAAAQKDEADRRSGQTPNIYVHEQTAYFGSQSTWRDDLSGMVTVQLDIPDDLVGEVYDFEFILGLQNPRWDGLMFPNNFPPGMDSEIIPGGWRIFSDEPIPENTIIELLVEGAEIPEDARIRIELTDQDHDRLGYTRANSGAIIEPLVIEDPQDDTLIGCTDGAPAESGAMAIDIQAVSYPGNGTVRVKGYGMMREFYEGNAAMGPAFSASVQVSVRLPDRTVIVVAKEQHDSPNSEDLVTAGENVRMSSSWISEMEVEIRIERQNESGEYEPVDLSGAEIDVTAFSLKTETGQFTCDKVRRFTT